MKIELKTDIIKKLKEDVENYVKNFPLPVDIESIISDINVSLSFLQFDDPDTSGECGRDIYGNYYISINNLEPIYRQRFTMAHELGHIVLHIFDKPGNSKISISDSDIVMYRKNAIDDTEREANEFASKILMPKKKIISELKKIIESNFTIESLFDIQVQVINKLASIFLVSPTAMKVRLIKLGILTNEMFE